MQTASSWTRENTTDNNYLYNSANELNKNTGWYEMYFRGYDPATGRMLQVDPYATMYASASVYNYALGNPVMMNDPSGGKPNIPSLGELYNLEQLKERADEAMRTGGGGGGMNTGMAMDMFGIRDGGSFYTSVSGPFRSSYMNSVWQMQNDARTMFASDYAKKYGTSFGGGLSGIASAITWMNKNGMNSTLALYVTDPASSKGSGNPGSGEGAPPEEGRPLNINDFLWKLILAEHAGHPDDYGWINILQFVKNDGSNPDWRGVFMSLNYTPSQKVDKDDKFVNYNWIFRSSMNGSTFELKISSNNGLGGPFIILKARIVLLEIVLFIHQNILLWIFLLS